MKHKQAIWASKHDWFIKATYDEALGEHSVTVRDWEFNVESRLYDEVSIRFTDYQQLREWAGY